MYEVDEESGKSDFELSDDVAVVSGALQKSRSLNNFMTPKIKATSFCHEEKKHQYCCFGIMPEELYSAILYNERRMNNNANRL